MSTWQDLIESRCPALHRMIAKGEQGKIDPVAVQALMERLDLAPCDPNKHDCLEKQCSALWKYYVETRRKDVGVPGEARMIADHLFSERNNLSFRPGDLAFLYDVSELPHDGTSAQGAFRIQRKSGAAVLRVYGRSDTSHGLDVLRVLRTEHPALDDYFVAVWAVERSAAKKRTYVLTEPMDGSLEQFRTAFKDRDPHFWHRVTRMLIHALQGLALLHSYGFGMDGHGTLMYRLDWSTIEEEMSGLVAVKWMSAVQPAHDFASDQKAFGLLVWSVLHGLEKPHTPLTALLEPNAMQPLSTAAYHMASDGPESRWTARRALEFIAANKPPGTSILPGLDTRAFVDW